MRSRPTPGAGGLDRQFKVAPRPELAADAHITAPADAERQRVALHELSHALVGRALGWRVRTIVTVPGVGKLGWCDHHERDDLSAFEAALDRTTILLAGEIGEFLVPTVVPLGYIEPIDDDLAVAERTFVEALDLLADRGEAASIYAMQSNGGDGLTDSDRAEQKAALVGGEERHWLYGYCSARARRIVGEQAALIVALLPAIVRGPLVTGGELEALIQDRHTRAIEGSRAL